MNILVCVKQVPNTKVTKIDPQLDPKTNTLIRSDIPAIANPFDEFAMELAARVKDAHEGVQITVLSMGPAQADAVLKQCLSVGGDHAYLLSDPAFRGSDTLATSFILSSAVRYLEEREGRFDLIFCGKQAIDGETAQVGPELAEYLGYAQATYVTEVTAQDGGVEVNRETADGYERIWVQYPAVLTITKTAYEPRLPSIKSKLASIRAVIPTFTAKELGLDPEKCGLKGSRTKVIRSCNPEKKAGCMKIKEETGAESAHKLFDLLHSEHII